MDRKIIYSIFFLISGAGAFAQSPDHYPPPVPQPVDITLFNLILYIVLPIGLVVAFFLYQRSQKKKRNNMMNKRDNNSSNDT